jgi:hypothetical protein
MTPPLAAESMSLCVKAELQPVGQGFQLNHEGVGCVGADTKEWSDKLYLPGCGTWLRVH